jgi:uncharacterized protein
MSSGQFIFTDVSFSDIDIDPESSNKPLGEGGYGLTWLAKYRPRGAVDDKYQDVVIKVLKTDTTPKSGSDPYKDFLEEIQHLQTLRHQGIVRIIRQGTCMLRDIPTPYYLTEWEDASALDNVLKCTGNGSDKLLFVFKFLSSILEALAYCHRYKIIHLDIKPDNILIKFNKKTNAFEHCIPIDFGKAKTIMPPLQNEGDKTTPGGGVWEYVHPNLRRYLRNNKVEKKLFDYGPEGFDLYSVSTVLKKDLLERVVSTEQLSQDFQFLNLLASDLENRTAGCEDFTLFSAEDGLRAIHQYQSNKKLDRKSIRLSTGITVGISSLAQEIIDTPEFQRLRRITQLSLTHLVYPSATHTRFSHSIGAYYMAEKYAKALMQEPLFCIKHSPSDIELLKIKALLHDVGHYPMAHYFEEFGNNLKHLEVGHNWYEKRLLRGDIKCPDTSGCQHIADVIEQAGILSKLFPNEKGTLLDTIISGPVDCDKLDYLIRDGLSCGVPYAESIDIDRFLSSLTWINNEKGGYSLAITQKGIAAAETILTARYQLFAEVYWHKTCRAAVAMTKEAFLLCVKHELINQEAFECHVINEDDNGVLEWLQRTLARVNPKAASDLIGNALIPSGNRSLYKRITTYAKTWDEGISDMLYDEFGRSIDRLSELKSYLVMELNTLGKAKMPGRWRNLEPHQLLVDMPPKDKATLGGLFVKYPESVIGKQSELLSVSSSVVKSLSDAFSQKVSRVRIYCHPLFCEQILQVTSGDARTLFDSAIKSFFSKV